jgi:hypothetical protein
MLRNYAEVSNVPTPPPFMTRIIQYQTRSICLSSNNEIHDTRTSSSTDISDTA